MEWVIAVVFILGMLYCGIVSACGVFRCLRKVNHPIGKISALTGAVILPFLFVAAIWLYNGIAYCSYCNSITDNSYTADNWITKVNICRKCVEYVDVCESCVKYVDSETAKLFKEPEKNAPVQHYCRTCDGDINMYDDEIGELFLQAVLVIWLIGYWLTMLAAGSVWVIKKCKKTVAGNL